MRLPAFPDFSQERNSGRSVSYSILMLLIPDGPDPWRDGKQRNGVLVCKWKWTNINLQLFIHVDYSIPCFGYNFKSCFWRLMLRNSSLFPSWTKDFRQFGDLRKKKKVTKIKLCMYTSTIWITSDYLWKLEFLYMIYSWLGGLECNKNLSL